MESWSSSSFLCRYHSHIMWLNRRKMCECIMKKCNPINLERTQLAPFHKLIVSLILLFLMNIIKQSVSLQENIYLLSSHFDCTIFQYLINFFSILIYFGLKIINSKINYVSMNFQHKLSRLYVKRRSEKQYYTVILPIMSHHVNWYMVRKCYMEGTENDQRQGTKFLGPILRN